MRQKIELLLKQIHQRKYCHLVGNGTVAIYLALKACHITGKKVALPNGVCPNVPLAIYLAGCEPCYLDISKENYGLDLEELKKTQDLAAVIAVHAYGVPCCISEIEAYCKKQGIFLVEDAAVAQGARVNGRPVGSFGDVSVVSFGAGKIVDAGGGGVVLTDDIDVYKKMVYLDSQLFEYKETFSQKISALGEYHTRLYNDVYLANEWDRLPGLFKLRSLEVGACFFYRFWGGLEKEILEKLECLPDLIKRRVDSAEYLYEALSGCEDIECSTPHFPNGLVPWRFNLLVQTHRNQLLFSLLKKKVKVSSWYPSVDLFFEQRSLTGVNTPISDDVSSKILNLWVNESVDRSYLNEIVRHITHNL